MTDFINPDAPDCGDVNEDKLVLVQVEALLSAMKVEDKKPSQMRRFDHILKQVKIALAAPTINPTLVDDARELSSGTIASLTKLCRYDEIEVVQAEFVNFCRRNQRCNTWVEAWNKFPWKTVAYCVGFPPQTRCDHYHLGQCEILGDLSQQSRLDCLERGSRFSHGYGVREDHPLPPCP